MRTDKKRLSLGQINIDGSDVVGVPKPFRESITRILTNRGFYAPNVLSNQIIYAQ